MKNQRAVKGSLIELRVCTALIEHGYPVYMPVVQSGQTDCIIETSVGFKKVQIKVARRKHKSLNNYYARVTQHRSNINYAEYDIDFILCEGDNRFFILPKESFENHKFDMALNGFEGRWDLLPPPSVFEIPKKEKKKTDKQNKLFAIK